MTTTTTTMTVTPHPGAGIEIRGLDVRSADDATFGEIRDLFHHHGLVSELCQTLFLRLSMQPYIPYYQSVSCRVRRHDVILLLLQLILAQLI